MKKFGPDWNKNGKTDAFDHFMNMKVINSIESKPFKIKRKKRNTHPTGIYIGDKQIYDAKKDSDGMTIFKTFLVTALCIGGMVLPIWAKIGGLAGAFFPLGAVALSVLILKTTNKK